MGIPTYNGEKTIINLLNSIKIQKFDRNNIEILIINNCSIDKTDQLIKSFTLANTDININYLVNETNLGYDGNILKLVHKCKGKYIWFIGDDDLLINDSIEKVINIINSNIDLSFIYTNFYQSYNKFLKSVPYTKVTNDNIYVNAESLFKNIGIDNNFLSTNIISSDIIKQNIVFEYTSTSWMHYHLFLNSLKIDYKSYAFTIPLVINNGLRPNIESNAANGGKWIKILINFIKILETNEISKKYRYFYSGKILYKLPFKINNAIRYGYCRTEHDLKFFNSYFKNSFFYWFFCFPLFYFDKNFHVFLYKLIKFFKL